jgi:hypothetical protein
VNDRFDVPVPRLLKPNVITADNALNDNKLDQTANPRKNLEKFWTIGTLSLSKNEC